MKKYAAFLRGINVGGNTLVPMLELKDTLEKNGCTNVKTILASGNAVFEHDETDIPILTEKFEKSLVKKFGFPIKVIIRKGEEITALVKSDPFVNIKITPETRLYVTFSREKTDNKLKFKEKEFELISVADFEVCSKVELSPGKGTTELMKLLEKALGKNITTRNWNTVVKIAKILKEL